MASSSTNSSIKNSAAYYDFQFSSSEPKPIAEPIHHYPPQPRHQQTPPPLNNVEGLSVAIPPPAGVYMGRDYGGAYNFSDIDQALAQYGFDGAMTEIPGGSSVLREQMIKESSGMRPPTLNIFPSQPMHVAPSPSVSAKASAGLVSTSPSSSGSKRQGRNQEFFIKGADL